MQYNVIQYNTIVMVCNSVELWFRVTSLFIGDF